MTASQSTDLERLRHPDEALETVLSFARPLETELVPLAEAAWRVLAHDLVATENHPPFPASTMDGYAVLAADVSPWREVLGVQNAGDVIDAEVTDGYTVKIMTGAPVPRGADAVVKVENSSIIDDHVVITQGAPMQFAIDALAAFGAPVQIEFATAEDEKDRVMEIRITRVEQIGPTVGVWGEDDKGNPCFTQHINQEPDETGIGELVRELIEEHILG